METKIKAPPTANYISSLYKSEGFGDLVLIGDMIYI